MKVNAYIIHLERSVNRDGNVARLVAECPVPAYVQDATDGSRLGQAEIGQVYVRRLHQPGYPFELRSSEIGIFLSHRACWKRLLDEGVDAALIVEDDIRFGGDFGTGFELAMRHIAELEFIQFPVRKFRMGTLASRMAKAYGNVRIVEPYVVPLGACAQLVSSTAAERLLRTTRQFDRSIDCLLQLRNSTEQPVFSVVPSGVSEISRELGGSTIHVKDGRTSWAERELRRCSYRTKVWLVSHGYIRSAGRVLREG